MREAVDIWTEYLRSLWDAGSVLIFDIDGVFFLIVICKVLFCLCVILSKKTF